MKRFLTALTFLAVATTACASLATSSRGSGNIPPWASAARQTAPAESPSAAPEPTSSLSPAPLPSGSPVDVDPGADPIVQVVQRALPAVVNVTTNLLEQNPFGDSTPGRGVGTGFI